MPPAMRGSKVTFELTRANEHVIAVAELGDRKKETYVWDRPFFGESAD